MTESPLSLAGDFPPPTQEQWDAEVVKVLNRRRPPDKQLSIEQCMKRLRTHTVDGLDIEPLYLSTDQPLGYPGVMPFVRGNRVRNGDMLGWDVASLHEDPDVKFTNTEALTDLENGVTSLWFRIDDDAIKPADLKAVLDGVMPELAPIRVTSTGDVSAQSAAAEALADVWRAGGKAAECVGSLGLDAFSAAERDGVAPDLSQHRVWARIAQKEFPKARALVADTRVLHDAGAGDTGELAYAVATGVEYLRDLVDAGMTPEAAASQILFRMVATADEFTTIAKFRALRRLWARVAEVVGIPEPERGALLHAVTSWRMITRDDPYVNLLRGTIASFASSVGGAEIITTLPFDTAHGLPTKASRRFARNTQLLAMEESNIGRVNDPAGGSFYVEELTEQIAEHAWAIFQEIEAAGGMAAALTSGLVAEQLAATTAERAKRLALRTLPITGVSMFPLEVEPDVETRPRPAAPEHSGLQPHRDAEVFEGLRDRASAAAAETGSKPAVFLACLGRQRDFGAREQFTSALVIVAGLATPRSQGGTVEEVVEQAKQANTPVAILCSSSKVYAEHAIEVAKALKDAGIKKVLLAGKYGETGSDEAADVLDGEVFTGMDVVGFLTDTLNELGVAK